MSQLKLPWRFPIGRHACGVNRGNRAGKADGRNAVGRHRHGDNRAFVESDALNGRFRERGSRGKEQEAKE